MSPDNVRAFLAIVAVFAIIIGFFLGVVSSEIFSATIGGLIAQFYQAGKVADLSKKVETQEAEIQSLKSNG
jgi:hypothetical protein